MRRKSSNRFVQTLGAIAILALALPAMAQKGSGTTSGCSGARGKGFNVTSIVADTDSNLNPFQIQSDGLGPYVTYKTSRTDSVLSEIQGFSCDWVLDLKGSQSRTIGLSLAYMSPGATLPPGWPTDGSPVDVAANFISKCERNPSNNGVSYGTMKFAGQKLQCPLNAGFYFNGVLYGLRLDPTLFADTTWTQVTCSGAVSNLCNAWTVTPIPGGPINSTTGNYMAAGELILPSCEGCSSGTPLGLYYVGFSAAIHQ